MFWSHLWSLIESNRLYEAIPVQEQKWTKLQKSTLQTSVLLWRTGRSGKVCRIKQTDLFRVSYCLFTVVLLSGTHSVQVFLIHFIDVLRCVHVPKKGFPGIHDDVFTWNLSFEGKQIHYYIHCDHELWWTFYCFVVIVIICMQKKTKQQQQQQQKIVPPTPMICLILWYRLFSVIFQVHPENEDLENLSKAELMAR